MKTSISMKYLLQIISPGQQKKRAFFSAPCASFSLEAALVLPIFLVFAVGLISFLMIISLQMDIQEGLFETARDLSRKAYLAQSAQLESPALGPAAVSIALRTPERKNRIDNSRIVGGAVGVNTLLSSYDAETGILDAAAGYTYSIPILPERISHLYLEQRLRTHVWIGRELDSCGEDADKEQKEEDAKTVYVTENGSVYHTSKDCTYLDLSIRQISKDSVESERNNSGSKYGCCPFCAKYAGAQQTVYVTDYGENWHVSLACPGLKRTIRQMDISEVGNLPLCTKCGSRHSQ